LAEYNVGTRNLRSDPAHEPFCDGQLVEGFDCGQRATYEHAAHTEFLLSSKGVGQGEGRIAIPVFHGYLPLGTYKAYQGVLEA